MHHGLSRLWTTLVLLPFIGSCATPTIKHEYVISPGREFGPSIETALLLPLNETIETQAGLEQGMTATTALLVEYLTSKGLEVERPPTRDYQKAVEIAANVAQRELLAGESESVSEDLAFTDVIPHLLVALESNADIILAPNLVLRTGNYGGAKSIRWDGVRRSERGTRGMNMTGSLPVASLFVVIYDKEGVRVFSGYGGLDLLFELNVGKRRYDLREDRLQNDDHLAEGVCISLHPFFGHAENC